MGMPVLAESSFQELMNTVIDAALRAHRSSNTQRVAINGQRQLWWATVAGQSQPPTGRWSSRARRLLFGLQGLLPQIDQYLPSRATAVRNKMTEIGMGSNQRMAFNQMNSLMQQGTADSLLAAAPAAPPQMQSRLYQQAAQKALDEGDADRARQIASEHLQGTSRDRVLQKVDFQLVAKKVQADNMDELRQALGNLRSDDERIDLLLQLATQAQITGGEPKPAAAASGDSELALKFLAEAQRLTNRRATSYQHFDQQLRVADAFASLIRREVLRCSDPELLNSTNLLSAAAHSAGSRSIFSKMASCCLEASDSGDMVSRYGQQLAILAKRSARAESSANKFQLAEPRPVFSIGHRARCSAVRAADIPNLWTWIRAKRIR